MKQQTSMRSLAPNSLILTASNILSAVLGFSLSLIVGRGLGEAGFGIWTFCLAWAALLTMICEFGLNSLLTREASQMPDKSNRLLVVSLALKIFFVSIIGGGVWFFAPVLALDSESSAALSVSVLIAVANVVYGSFTAIFRSSGWMSPILWLNVLGGLIQLGWSAWILSAGGSILSLIWIAAAVDFGQVLIAILLWWNRLRPQGGTLEISRVDAIQMARDTIPFAVSAFLGAIEARSSVLLLGYLRGETEVGQFGMASRFFEAARLIPNGIYDAAFPALAAAKKSRERNDRKLFQQLGQIILVYTVSVAMFLILFSRRVIHLTYGDIFISATPTLTLLGVALLPTLHNALMEVYLFATGDEKYATKLGFFGLTFQVLASFPLMFFYGASGAAIGLLIGELAIWLPLRWRIMKQSS
jgi:O-antigen/teichoic acid export membrane protein